MSIIVKDPVCGMELEKKKHRKATIMEKTITFVVFTVKRNLKKSP